MDTHTPAFTRTVHVDKGLLRGVADFVATEGLGGVYRGLLPTVVKSSCNQALRFLTFGEYFTLI